MPPINKIINAVLHGENNFCALCFKIDQKMVFHDEINIDNDETEQNIVLSEILLSVFGNEMQEYLSTFENICEDCLNLIISIYKYIQICNNNATSLMQALDGLDKSFNYNQDDIGISKSLFISMNINNSTNQLTYDDKKLDSKTVALQRYKLLNRPKINDISAMKEEAKTKKSDTPSMKTSDMLLNPNDELPRCKECLKTYPSLYNLRTHFLRVHAPKDYKCTKCSKAYRSPGLVAYHMTVDHCEIICSECGKEFTSKYSFMRHELSHHLQLVCPDCGRLYKSSITYKRHIELNVCKQKCRADPVNAQYTCDYCGKKYTQKMSLRVHIQYDHGNYKAHVCKWCGKKFWAQSRLKAHIVKHTKEKNFICLVCQGKFVTRESLLYHSRLHTGEKPYKCTQCDCTFVSSSRRAYHMKTYHLRAMVECDICHSKFSSRAYLDKHKKSHRECQNVQVKEKKNVTENFLKKKFKKQNSSGMDGNDEFLVFNNHNLKCSVKMPDEAQPPTNESYIFIGPLS